MPASEQIKYSNLEMQFQVELAKTNITRQPRALHYPLLRSYRCKHVFRELAKAQSLSRITKEQSDPVALLEPYEIYLQCQQMRQLHQD